MGSRLVLGASTAALVLVASGGTAILVSHGAKQLQNPPLSAPAQVAGPRPGPSPLVLPRAPGSALFGPSRPAARPAVDVAPPQAVVDEPVVAPPPAVGPPPVVAPPVVEPPVVEPPVVEPPVVEPPVVTPAKPGADKGRGNRGTKTNKGHHYGQIKHPKG